MTVTIMHQHAAAGHIIRMEPCDVEIIDVNRRLQKLVLDLFNDYIFAIDQDENISRAKMHRVCPAFDWGVEGMPRRSYDLFAIDEDMNQLVRLVNIGLHDGAKRDFTGLLIPGPNPIAGLNLLNRFAARISTILGSFNETKCVRISKAHRSACQAAADGVKEGITASARKLFSGSRLNKCIFGT